MKLSFALRSFFFLFLFCSVASNQSIAEQCKLWRSPGGGNLFTPSVRRTERFSISATRCSVAATSSYWAALRAALLAPVRARAVLRDGLTTIYAFGAFRFRGCYWRLNLT